MMKYINKNWIFLCFFLFDPCNFFQPFLLLQFLLARQRPALLTCTPALPVASSEGRVEHLGLRHQDWRNFTALANSALTRRHRCDQANKGSHIIPTSAEVELTRSPAVAQRLPTSDVRDFFSRVSQTSYLVLAEMNVPS